MKLIYWPFYQPSLLPSKSKNVFLSLGPVRAKEAFRSCAATLQSLNYNLFATTGTAEYLRGHNIEATTLHKPSSKRSSTRFSISLMVRLNSSSIFQMAFGRRQFLMVI